MSYYGTDPANGPEAHATDCDVHCCFDHMGHTYELSGTWEFYPGPWDRYRDEEDTTGREGVDFSEDTTLSLLDEDGNAVREVSQREAIERDLWTAAHVALEKKTTHWTYWHKKGA